MPLQWTCNFIEKCEKNWGFWKGYFIDWVCLPFRGIVIVWEFLPVVLLPGVFFSFHSNFWFECVLSDHNRVVLTVSFYLFWSFWSFSALCSSLTISDDLPGKVCEKHEKYWQFMLDRRIILFTYLSLSFDPANQIHGCTGHLPSHNPLQDQYENTDWERLAETCQSVKELKCFSQQADEIYSAW